jgi:hypothetical protein
MVTKRFPREFQQTDSKARCPESSRQTQSGMGSMKFNRTWMIPTTRTRQAPIALAAALIGVCAVTAPRFAPASAVQLDPIPKPSSKTWPGVLYPDRAGTYEYVTVHDVRNLKGPTDWTDGSTAHVVVLYVKWEIDCKYKHPTMDGWMYRGTKIETIEQSGGQVDGYYEVNSGNSRVNDETDPAKGLAAVDEFCF